MERSRSTRKRKQPARYVDKEVVHSLRDEIDESDNMEVEQPLDSERNIVEQTEKRPRLLTRKPERKEKPEVGVGVVYRMLRRTVGSLTSKLNEISEEVKNNKSSIENLVVNQSTSVESIENQTRSEGYLANDQLNALEVETIKESEEGQEKGLSNEQYRNAIYNVRNLNIEKPKFGDKNVVHPVTFLEDLENYLRKASKEGKELDLIQECLVGDAREWARIYKGRWKNVEDFKIDFLATYWGENEQSELRRSIVQGCWDRKVTPSMLNHFLRITGRAQMLSYKLPEKQMVTDVIRHYPRYVQQVWATSNIDTIIGTAEFLRSMDDINKQDAHVYTTPEPTKNFEKKRNEIQQSYRNWQKPTETQKRVNYRTPAVNSIEEGNSQSQMTDQNVVLN